MIQIYGASGHAKVIIEIAELNELVIGNIVDGNEHLSSILDYPISLPTSNLQNLPTIIAIGNNLVRANIVQQLAGMPFCTLVHPASNISKRVAVGEGTVVMAGVSINSSVNIGQHCIINTNASIDHDCVIQDYVHISPNAALAGNVEVGAYSHIGMGACIIQGKKIGRHVQIGAGAVIIQDIPDYAVVVGNPGKIIKYTQL